MPLTIAPARSADDLAAVAALFRAYAASLGIDLAYQGFEAELAGLPGRYAAPRGALLLARSGADALGCVGVRPLSDGDEACEMKRLYVGLQGRGTGAGRALAAAAIAFAAGAGYRRLLLDTLPSMTAAIGLYRALGFVAVAPYWSGSPPGTLYFARDLASGRTQDEAVADATPPAT
jgi:ribosomal protein S18 acetylase RimI-like enzyme